MNATIRLAAMAILLVSVAPAFAGEGHGHCSGPNVCKGDADCEKKGFKEMTREECSKIDGAKFDAAPHSGKEHSHDHDK